MPQWQEARRKAQEHRDKSIAAVRPRIPDAPANSPLNVSHLPAELLSPRECTITEMPVEKLAELLATARISSVEVTNAFLRRAGVAQKLTNCVTELLPDRALERAKTLDEHMARHGRPAGPLHGVPISVKEHFGMAGLTQNAGFCAWTDRTAPADAVVLRILQDAGAIFHARTTQPQTLMHLETASNLFGATVNPFNVELTAGGSSGGEGALMGMRGSCLGLGTDIGGSVRCPAANCGLYGLKPTSYRVPVGGLAATMLGQEHIVSSLGAFSTSLDGLRLLMRTVLEAKPWLVEPSLVPMPWKESDESDESDESKGRPKMERANAENSRAEKRLKIAIMWEDGVVRPHPPVSRALAELSTRLKAIPAFDVVDWTPYKHDLAWYITSGLYFADGGAEERSAIDSSGEPWLPLSDFIINQNPRCKNLSVAELWERTRQRDAYRAEYAAVWNGTASESGSEGSVDVILCPAGPGAAPPLDCSRYWGYTAQWNLLDYPAVVFPVSRVDPAVDVQNVQYSPRNEADANNHRLYDPARYRDAPICLQLVARRFEDEKLVEALRLIQSMIDLPFAA